MAKILRRDVLTVGGRCSKFIGVQLGELGEFVLRPDGETGPRPPALRVQDRKTTLVVVVEGGGEVPFRTKLQRSGEISCREFQSRLTDDQRALLAELVSDLRGRIWPNAGETLLKRIEVLGEDKLLKALQNLFKGVEGTMRRLKIHS